jgi:hypothetical protein
MFFPKTMKQYLGREDDLFRKLKEKYCRDSEDESGDDDSGDEQLFQTLDCNGSSPAVGVGECREGSSLLV